MTEYDWSIQRVPFESQDDQRLYGDDAIVVVSGDGKEAMWAGVTEVIDDIGPRFFLAHILNSLRSGGVSPDDVDLAGEISAWAAMLKTTKRRPPAKRKVARAAT